MGRRLIISGLKLTDLSAPKLVTVDAIESSGSLLLIEPMNSASPWAAGVPANGSSVVNLMKDFAGKLGVGNPAVGATIYSSGMSSPVGLLERSGKGGLHGIVSKLNTPGNGAGFSIDMSDAIKSYLLANQNHKYFASVWRKVTRTGSIEQFSGVHNASGSTNNNLFIMGADLTRPLDGGATYAGSRVMNRNAVGNSLVNIGANGWVGSVSAPIANLFARACSWGRAPGVGGATSNVGSQVFYRFYLEDLTVSGRTYAEVDALDYAQFDKQVLTQGGRYYGDTHTDPAALP